MYNYTCIFDPKATVRGYTKYDGRKPDHYIYHLNINNQSYFLHGDNTNNRIQKMDVIVGVHSLTINYVDTLDGKAVYKTRVIPYTEFEPCKNYYNSSAEPHLFVDFN